jgi:hypothetical protein
MGYVTIYHALVPAPASEMVLAQGQDYVVSAMPGPLEIRYSTARPDPTNGGALDLGQEVRAFAAGSYIVVAIATAVGTTGTLGEGWRRALSRFAQVVAALELDFPGVLGEKLYEGTFISPDNPFFLSPEEGYRFGQRAAYDLVAIQGALQSRLDGLDAIPVSDLGRFTLASRWFRRANDSNNSIDRLLFYYTALEVYPATGSTDVPGVVSRFLAEKVAGSLSSSEVKARLDLGRICGFRAEIVHNGKASCEPHEVTMLNEYVQKLQAVTRTCLRILANIPPGNDLEKYLKMT